MTTLRKFLILHGSAVLMAAILMMGALQTQAFAEDLTAPKPPPKDCPDGYGKFSVLSRVFFNDDQKPFLSECKNYAKGTSEQSSTGGPSK